MQNVIFALGVKFAVLLLASIGLANMWIGVLADVGVAILCILNAMRMLKK
jgi:Cd2+/Zn2+-exporting ATPase